uniref:Si:ch211-63p21.8 n=1 Tax=Oryzias melastigma TaxID=30732 RepID=A0A3B3CD05_ORYME
LTDLTLTGDDGSIFHVHSLTLAAVSLLVQEKLMGKSRNSSDFGLQRWSIDLGASVNQVGLQAVVEFAYSGDVPSMNESIQTAAEVLKVVRLLDLCTKENDMRQPALMVTLQSIHQLWEDRVGCDVVLDVGGTFLHHRVILAASSDFFRAMFTCGMKESHQNSISFPCLPAPELEALVGFSYSRNLTISWDSVFEVTIVALQLQFRQAVLLCLNFMEEQMNPASCLDVASFAEAYGLSELLDEAKDFVLRNFREVSTSAKFRDLPVEKLLELLHCDGLCVSSELAVFRAVISWIEANPEERLTHAGLLMSAVRFPLMTFREFREVRAINLQMECFADKNVELYGSALKEFGFSLPNSQDCYRVRKPKDVLVVVGGDQLNCDVGQRVPSREMWFSNSLRSGTGLVKEMEWRRLGEIPDKPKFRHGVAVMQGKLYVAGGCYFYAKDDVMKSAYFDPRTDSWMSLADMNEARSNFSMAVHEERLYAIGGDREINTNTETVEMYNQDTNSWFVKPLDRSLSGFALSAVKGGIFISGGFDCSYSCLASMFLYHPDRGTTHLSDMTQDRAQHCMEPLRGHLIVAGGVCNLRKFYTDQLACEMYDPEADSWTALTPLPVPHVGAASAVLEEKVYVLGGYSQEDYTESGLVHRFEHSTRRWENVGKVPSAVTDIRACILRLPQHLRH